MADNSKTCSQCCEKPVWLDRASGRYLCKKHLIESVEGDAYTYLKKNNLPDKVGIAFSGGKDSSALLAAVSVLQKDFSFTPVALTIDEGINGYREDTIKAANEITDKLKIEHYIISFKTIFGKTLDEMVVGRENRACTICGILRRRALEILAKEHEIDVIATGHNLDDRAQTAIMNAISGDTKKVFSGRGVSSYVRRIKPFENSSEREVTIYAMVRGVFNELPECPYATSSLRGEVRHLLNIYERSHPGTMRNAAICEEEIREKLGKYWKPGKHYKCSLCGYPSSSEICQVCKLTKEV